MSICLYKRMMRLIFRNGKDIGFFECHSMGDSQLSNTGTASPAQTFFMIVYRMVKYTIEEGNEDVYNGH